MSVNVKDLINDYKNMEKELENLTDRDSEYEKFFENSLTDKPVSDKPVRIVREISGAGSSGSTAIDAMEEAAKQILPSYNSWGDALFSWDMLSLIMSWENMNVLPVIVRLMYAYVSAKINYESDNDINKKEAETMLYVADNAYERKPSVRDYTKIPATDIPTSLQSIYDSSSGVIDDGEGLNAWVGKDADGTIVLAYSGTYFTNYYMVKADIAQVLLNSSLYYRGAGLLNLMLKQFPKNKFIVAGHSLGGGLTQFAVTANINVSSKENALKGYCYNPAGLSKFSLNALNSDNRLDKSKKVLYTFKTVNDPVSKVGANLGKSVTLPFCYMHNNHFIDDVKVCMEKYVENNEAHVITVGEYRYPNRYKLADGYAYMVIQKDGEKFVKDYCWNNYGGEWKDDEIKQDVVTTSVYKDWLLNFCPVNQLQLCGVELYVNGVGRTCAARQLLIGPYSEDFINEQENDPAIIWFGIYGLGKKKLKKRISDSFKEIDGKYILPAGILNDVLGRIDDCTDEEIRVWYNALKNYVGMDVDNILGNHYEKAYLIARDCLAKWTVEREKLYEEYDGYSGYKYQDLLNNLKTGICTSLRKCLLYLEQQGLAECTESDIDTYCKKSEKLLGTYENALYKAYTGGK